MTSGLTLDQINEQIAELDRWAENHWRGHHMVARRRAQLDEMRNLWIKRDLENELADVTARKLAALVEAKRETTRVWAAPTSKTIRRYWRDVLFGAELMLSEKMVKAAKGIGLLSYERKRPLTPKQRHFWAAIAGMVEPIVSAISSTRTQTLALLEM